MAAKIRQLMTRNAAEKLSNSQNIQNAQAQNPDPGSRLFFRHGEKAPVHLSRVLVNPILHMPLVIHRALGARIMVLLQGSDVMESAPSAWTQQHMAAAAVVAYRCDCWQSLRCHWYPAHDLPLLLDASPLQLSAKPPTLH